MYQHRYIALTVTLFQLTLYLLHHVVKSIVPTRDSLGITLHLLLGDVLHHTRVMVNDLLQLNA